MGNGLYARSSGRTVGPEILAIRRQLDDPSAVLFYCYRQPVLACSPRFCVALRIAHLLPGVHAYIALCLRRQLTPAADVVAYLRLSLPWAIRSTLAVLVPAQAHGLPPMQDVRVHYVFLLCRQPSGHTTCSHSRRRRHWAGTQGLPPTAIRKSHSAVAVGPVEVSQCRNVESWPLRVGGESAAAWGLGNGKVRQRWGAVAWGAREVLAVVERWWWS